MVRLTSGVVFALALAGQSELERIGVASGLPVPDRFVAVVFALLILGPGLRRSVGKAEPDLHHVALAQFVFFAYLIVSQLWRPVAFLETRQPTVALDVATMAMLAVLLSMCLWSDWLAVVDTWAWLGLGSGLAFAVVGILAGEDRAAAFGGGPNVFARITGVGVISCLILIYGLRRTNLLMLTLPPLVLATVFSGSRGGMLSLGVGLVPIGIVVIRRLRGRDIALISVIAAALILSVGSFRDRLDEVVQVRIVDLTIAERYDSGRLPMYQAAWDIFTQHSIFGVGLGGFESVYGYQYGETYPHNLLLQTAAEGGIVGLLLLCTAIGLTFRRLGGWVLRCPLSSGILGLSLLYLTASQFSGDFFDSRFFWLYSLMASAVFAKESRDTSTETTARFSKFGVSSGSKVAGLE